VNGTTLERPDVAAYLAAVRSELADLPAEERDDLLADVEASLLDSDESPALPPKEFAAELREAAGLEPGTDGRASSLLDAIRARLASERIGALRATARELAPIWWLARAYVAVVVVALALDWHWPLQGSVTQSALALAVAAVASIWFGLRRRRRGGGHVRLRLAANAALAIALLPVAAYSFEQLTYRPLAPYTASEPTPGLAVDGVQLTNLYPYTRDGRLLLDVLLYDENGRAIEIFPGADDPLRRVLVGADGSRFFNSFPIRYFDAGTTTVGDPELAPRVNLPEIVTPPLERAPR
jgi:hypothetical protein